MPRLRMNGIQSLPLLPVYVWLHGMLKENFTFTFYVYLQNRIEIVGQQIDYCACQFIYYILKL